jgi:hypothetical protein
MAQPGEDDEARKRITAALISGRPMLLLDNVRSLRSQSLEAVLTTTVWEDRLLGQTKMLRVRNTALWLATGNNVEVSDEMARRQSGSMPG